MFPREPNRKQNTARNPKKLSHKASFIACGEAMISIFDILDIKYSFLMYNIFIISNYNSLNPLKLNFKSTKIPDIIRLNFLIHASPLNNITSLRGMTYNYIRTYTSPTNSRRTEAL